MTGKRDDYLDAIAWIRCAVDRDHEGQAAIAHACDGVGLLDSLTAMYLALLIDVFGADRARMRWYLEALRTATEEAVEP